MANIATRKDREINDKQIRFCEEYVVDFEATKAAIRAGYSKTTSDVQASKMLTLPKIRRYIDGLLAERAKTLSIKAETVIMEIARLAFSNFKDICEWDENGYLVMKSSKELTREKTASIAQITQRQTDNKGTINTYLQVKMHDKTKSLELLCRHLGMFRDRDLEADKQKEIDEELESIDKSKIIDFLRASNG